jgi:hypothetical protein
MIGAGSGAAGFGGMGTTGAAVFGAPLWIEIRSNSPTGPLIGIEAGFGAMGVTRGAMFCGGGVEVC